MTPKINEDAVEQQALEWFSGLGYATAFGPEIASDSAYPQRSSYNDVILNARLLAALERINPDKPLEALQEAVRQIERERTAALNENNKQFHKYLTEGVSLEYRDREQQNRSGHVQLIDWENPANNDWLAVNQFTVIGKSNRRPDIVIFINGLPLVVIELKNPADENASIEGAYNQIKNYQQEIRQLFDYNAFSVISDGLHARMGSITSDKEWFQPWKTVDGITRTNDVEFELKTLIHGVFQQDYLLDLIRNFIVISGEGAKMSKKIAGYHQFHAVRKAVESTLKASHAKEGIPRAVARA